MSGYNFLLDLGVTKTKTVGKIYVEQMYIEDSDKWILPRISPKCENCNSNKHYNIICGSKVFVFVITRCEKIYKIVCPECGEAIELGFEEYLIIERFVKVNRKYQEGKISQEEYKNRIAVISNKYKRKHTYK